MSAGLNLPRPSLLCRTCDICCWSNTISTESYLSSLHALVGLESQTACRKCIGNSTRL